MPIVGPFEWRVSVVVRNAADETLAFTDLAAGSDIEPGDADRHELNEIARDAFAKVTALLERRHRSRA